MSRQLADKIRVKVLRRHIVKGLKGLSSGDITTDCVVAQALREKFPRTPIGVGVYWATVNKTNYTISQKGANLIMRAMGGTVKPTTITLTRDNE